MPAEIFTHEHRVTYADCTVGNHVYYGRYPDLLVSEVHLKYLAFAEYDDELRIECRLTAIRGARLGFGYRITKGEGVRILEGETLHGCVEASGRATRLPPALKERLQPYLDSE